MFYLDDAATLTSNSTDPLYDRIHAIARQMPAVRARIAQQISNVSNADATFDPQGLANDVQTLDSLTGQLAHAIADFKASPAGQADAQTAAIIDNYLAFAQEWARETRDAVGAMLGSVVDTTTSAGVSVAKKITDALGSILANTGKSLGAGLWPWLLGGVGLFALLLYGVRQAERTRSYRRYVA